MQELDDEQRGHFSLNDRHEKYFLPVDVNEIVMRGRDDWRHIFQVCGFFLSFKKIITDGTTDHTLPVFFQKYVIRSVDQKQTVNHDAAPYINVSKLVTNVVDSTKCPV
uniref:Uncharacterized protein n=1 Tax=Anguilla anguilla TaxID=7936 RepID=A0A0E9Q217_ANGAN